MTFASDQTGERFERWYLPVLLTLWCVAPGLRRLIDWQVGRNPLSIISILPMLALLPLAIVVWRNAASPRLRLPFRALTYVWMFGFVYAFVVAFAAGGRFGAVYDFAQFCLPLLVGVWVIVRPASRAQTFKTLTTTLLWLGVIESVYGIYQFIAPPPWDIAYINAAQQVSIGLPEPFSLHPFSTINSPGTLSSFLAVVVLLNLQRLSIARPWPLLSIILCVATLILTNVRSSWLALAVGTLAYLVMSPKRGRTLIALGVVGLVSLAFLLNASVLFGNPDVTQQLQSRFNSLSNVDQDDSVAARRAESNFALHQALEEPLGQGLGTVGGAVRLGDSGGGQMVLDNGYLSRFLEMGLPGFICYLVTLCCGLIFGFSALVRSFANRDNALRELAIAGLSVQVALIGLDLSSDYHSALSGLFFWLALGLALRYESGDEGPRQAWENNPARPPISERPLWV